MKTATTPRLLDGKTPTLMISQHGVKHWVLTRKELADKVGISHVDKMYVDTKTGPKHIGYVIGPHWFTAYRRAEVPA